MGFVLGVLELGHGFCLTNLSPKSAFGFSKFWWLGSTQQNKILNVFFALSAPSMKKITSGRRLVFVIGKKKQMVGGQEKKSEVPVLNEQTQTLI
jgi:hypothetical protein